MTSRQIPTALAGCARLAVDVVSALLRFVGAALLAGLLAGVGIGVLLVVIRLLGAL